jgi:hypothetical protein
MLVVPAGALSMRGNPSGLVIVRLAVLVLLLVLLGLGLLYAYRSQTPSVPQVDLGHALGDIGAGRVRAVTIFADTATIEFRDSPSHQERTALPDSDTTLVLSSAVSTYNIGHPSQATELRFETKPPWCCGVDRLDRAAVVAGSVGHEGGRGQ